MADRLVSITGPTNQSLFTYDGLGRRVKTIEKVNGVAISTNKCLWDGMSLCEERNGATVNKRFFGQGEQISGVNYYFTRDHLGSVREIVNSAGLIQSRFDYDPYGRMTKVSGTMNADFGYAGMYYHAASGLSLAVYRAYSPDLARWLSRDPIAEKGGLNLYTYVGGNPVNFLDELGLEQKPHGEDDGGFRYYIKTTSGKTYDSVVVTTKAVEQYRSVIDGIRQSGDKISEFNLYGHGEVNGTVLGNLLFGARVDIQSSALIGAREMERTLGGLFDSKSQIRLEFCHSSESPAIYNELHKIAPDATIFGVKGVNRGIGNYGPLIFSTWLRLDK
jgi:RHS repeat-associated protein